jgi:hypothetical protein
MHKEKWKILWLSLRSSAELILGVISVFYAILFFLYTPAIDLEPNKALAVFVFLFTLIAYFFGFGFYHLFTLVNLIKERSGWRSYNSYSQYIDWVSVAMLCLLTLLVITGLTIVFSGGKDIYYFFCQMNSYGANYWESVVLSFAPATAILFGGGITILGMWFLVTAIIKGRF